MRPTRLTDLVCDRHLATCDTRWRLPLDLSELKATCGDCRAAVQAALGLHGLTGAAVKPLPMLERRTGQPSAYERYDAIHEAGHAIVGLTTGRHLVEIALERSGRGVTGEDFDGWVLWKEKSVDCPDFGLPSIWAGQEATLRYLSGIGLTSPADRLDAYWTARGDAHLINQVTAGRDLPRDFGRAEAQQVLSRHWDVVEDLAAWLVGRTWLDGDRVTARYATTLGITRH